MKAQVCPVCNGSGQYSKLPDPATSAASLVGTCHGCAGKGWVSVLDDYYQTTIPAIRYYHSTYPGSGWWDQYGIWHSGY